jgi:hypothetical protein
LSQVADHRTLFREVNERIEAVSQQWTSLELICECVDTRCTATVALGRDEYERVRNDPGCFVVAPGHTVPDAEEVVAHAARYMVVRELQ